LIFFYPLHCFALFTILRIYQRLLKGAGHPATSRASTLYCPFLLSASTLRIHVCIQPKACPCLHPACTFNATCEKCVRPPSDVLSEGLSVCCALCAACFYSMLPFYNPSDRAGDTRGGCQVGYRDQGLPINMTDINRGVMMQVCSLDNRWYQINLPDWRVTW
jgi:hypothetical protein